MEPIICSKCNHELKVGDFPFCPHETGHGGAIVDECDVWIRHGICNPDGTPKRYRSKSEIKRAAFEAGLTHANDTPHVNQRLAEKAAMERERRR